VFITVSSGDRACELRCGGKLHLQRSHTRVSLRSRLFAILLLLPALLIKRVRLIVPAQAAQQPAKAPPRGGAVW
jgi:hypothetical protein